MAQNLKKIPKPTPALTDIRSTMQVQLMQGACYEASLVPRPLPTQGEGRGLETRLYLYNMHHAEGPAWSTWYSASQGPDVS